MLHAAADDLDVRRAVMDAVEDAAEPWRRAAPARVRLAWDRWSEAYRSGLV